MANRKHITELALDFCSDGILIMHPKDVSRIEQQGAAAVELANECHIYVIATRPRVSYVPGSVRVGDGKTSGRFKYSRNGAIKETEFWLKGEAIADKIEISEYPHHTLSLVRNDKVIASIPAHLASLICDHVGDSSLRDLRVVYVGMSYADGSRSAKDRLLSHSTLQQVLADLNGDSPESEALIIMAPGHDERYDSPQTLISFDGRDESLKIEDDRNLMDDLQRQRTDITEDLQIKLTEAALIRYFQPSYNEKYKNPVPSPELSRF